MTRAPTRRRGQPRRGAPLADGPISSVTRAGRRSAMSRRRFLALAGAAGLTACVDAGDDRTIDLGGRDRLRILNWPDYIDADVDDDTQYPGGTLDELARATGMIVDYEPGYTDNIDGFELVLERAVNAEVPAYDIVVPTNWRAAQMINNGWVEPVPIEVVPNHANIDPAFLTNSWDRGCRYQMPWQAGITGIAYDPAQIEPVLGGPITSITQLFDPALAGRVGFIGEMREAVGLVMLANGDDPSRPTDAAAAAAIDQIVELDGRGQIGAFTFEDFAPRLASGELAAAMAWSGDTALLQADRPDVEFVVPDEGAIQWFDTMVIPGGAANVAAAGRFMDFVYDPANAARVTRWVGYISPVLGVQEFLADQGGDDADLAANPLLFPDLATRARLFTWGGLDQDTEDLLDEQYAALLPDA
ncbi:MAG: spermidine/putrescine ABC transporter substrate-binding protein [Actinomycetota bacterium]